MTAREFFLNNKAFQDLNPDVKELTLRSLDVLEKTPQKMAYEMMNVFMATQNEISVPKAFMMGILVGFAGADDRTQFRRS